MKARITLITLGVDDLPHPSNARAILLADLDKLIEHIRNGYLKPSDIVTHRVPLEHIAEGYHIFSAKLDNCIKPLVVPSAA